MSPLIPWLDRAALVVGLTAGFSQAAQAQVRIELLAGRGDGPGPVGSLMAGVRGSLARGPHIELGASVTGWTWPAGGVCLFGVPCGHGVALHAEGQYVFRDPGRTLRPYLGAGIGAFQTGNRWRPRPSISGRGGVEISSRHFFLTVGAVYQGQRVNTSYDPMLAAVLGLGLRLGGGRSGRDGG